MAKSFNELKKGAEDIRTNYIAQSNTADVVGRQMLDMVEKQESEQTERLKLTTDYNVSSNFPTGGIEGTSRYTFETAVSKLPAALHRSGIKMTYLQKNNTWVTYLFNGNASEIADASKWVVMSATILQELGDSKSNTISQDGITKEFEKKLDVDTYQKLRTEINVSVEFPEGGVNENGNVGGDRYDLASAIEQVGAMQLKQGAVLSFKDKNDSGKTAKKEYLGGTVTYVDNWKDARGSYNTNIFDTKKVNDYSGYVAELYVYPRFLENNTLYAKVYANAFFVRTYNGSTLVWNSRLVNLSTLTDNVAYPLTCHASGGNVALNDIIGYVVFSNVSGVSALSDGSTGELLNKTYVTRDANFVKIAHITSPMDEGTIKTNLIANSAVTSQKIADGAITPNKLIGRNIFESENVHMTDIAELWIDPKYKDSTNGVKYYFKIFNNTVYVRPYKDNALPYLWNATISLSTITDYHNTPLDIVCNVAGNGVAVGDIIGAVVFVNNLSWNDSNGSLGHILTDSVFDIGRFPVVYATNRMSDNSIDTMENAVEVIIPDEIPVVVGDCLELFYRSTSRCFNPYTYDITAICSVGKNYPRCYIFTPDSSHASKTYPLKIDIKRNDQSVIATKTTTIRVISPMSEPEKNKNVLVFGASATANGNIAYELMRRLTSSGGDPLGLNLSNITFVGRKKATSKNVQLEATGGWSWVDYSTEGRPAYRFNITGITQLNLNDTYTANGIILTITEINVTGTDGNIRCTYSGANIIPSSGTLTRSSGSGDVSIAYTSVESESYNPFWNDGKLDFVNYANLYCNGAIDVLISHCGVNDIFAGRVGSALINDYVKPFARAFHADFPSAKFIISTLPLPDCTGGMGANYGASTSNYYNMSQRFWETAKALNSLVQDSEFASWISIADVVPQFDNENGYPKATSTVNRRSTITEDIGSNGVHPTEEGSYMVADVLFNAFNDLFT